MSDDHSGGEGSVGLEADFVDTTEDIEIGLRLPREVDTEQDRHSEDIRNPSGAVAPSEVALGQEERPRFEPPNGARSKWPRHGMPLPIISKPRSPVRGATANLGGPQVSLRRLGETAQIFPELTQRRRESGIKTPTWVELVRDLGFPGPGGQLPRGGTQFEPDPYEDVLRRKIDPDRRGRLRADLVPRCCVDGQGGTSTARPGRNEG